MDNFIEFKFVMLFDTVTVECKLVREYQLDFIDYYVFNCYVYIDDIYKKKAIVTCTSYSSLRAHIIKYLDYEFFI